MSENDRIIEEKQIGFYNNLVNGWITTKMEKDKSLMTLSAGGIGLLISLLVAKGTNSNFLLLLYFLSITLFSIVLISTIIIFEQNAKHLESEIKYSEENNKSLLNILDRISFFCFIIAIVLSLIIGLSSNINNTHKENPMDNSQKEKISKLEPTSASLKDIKNISPVSTDKKETTKKTKQ